MREALIADYKAREGAHGGKFEAVAPPPGTITTIEAWELFKFLILLISSGANGGR